jgi:phage terminase large subunit-like protein
MNNDLMEFIDRTLGAKSDIHPYFLFEPWDVAERSPEFYEKAKNDGFNLLVKETTDIIGIAPHPFQTGYIFDEHYISVMFASNQSGKSYSAFMDVLIMLTGEIPTALQYDKGAKTGIRRQVTSNNVKRFGRFRTDNGEFIDNNYNEPANILWDCGEVEGAGHYPQKKLAPPASKVWIVTLKQVRDEMWWPLAHGLIPPRMLDKSKANDGFDNRDHIIYLARGAQIHFITYEQGEQRLESAGNLQEFEKLVMVLFDEEPPSRKYWAAVTQRVNMIRLVTTPYKGLTWTHEDLFLKAKENPDIQIYHCSKYDCPYHTWKDIDRSKTTIAKWEIGARVWGLHTEQAGRPYYETLFDEIQLAVTNGREKCEFKRIYPDFVWDNPRVIAINREKMDMIECEDDARDAWRIYEMPEKDELYWMAIDSSEGSAEEKQGQDNNCAQILRKPKDKESAWPVQVATLHTTLPADEFARLCLYGAAAYNNTLIAPEALGKSSGTLLHEMTGWPFFFTMVITNDITKKQTEKIGFYTSSKNRTQIFNMVGSMLKECIEQKMFGLRQMKLITEIAGCIVGRNGRPDHARRKHNDALMAYAIGLYVFKVCSEQIRENSLSYKKKEEGFSRFATKDKETRPLLGSKMGLDQRSRIKTGRW